MATFGERFKELRKSKGLTQDQLAKLFFLNKSSISRYEKDLQLPEASTLVKFAEFFEVTLDYLMGNEADDSTNIELIIPTEYTDKYKVTSRDKNQYIEKMKKYNVAFFENENLDETDKKEMLDIMTEIFWKAKAQNKRKK